MHWGWIEASPLLLVKQNPIAYHKMMQGKMRQDLYQELYEVENHHWWHHHKRATIHQFIRQFSNPGRVLDVGAGTGKILEELKSLGWEVMGVDGEEEAAEWSARRGIHVKQTDLTKPLPFDSDTFDLVLALDILEHVSDDSALLSEMRRVVKPEGRVMVSVPAYQWLFNYWDEMLGHKRRYTAPLLRSVCSQSGVLPLYLGYYFCLFLIPAALVRFVKNKLGNTREGTSDFQTTPLASITVPIMNLYARFERWCLKRTRLPFGLSVFLVGTKSGSH